MKKLLSLFGVVAVCAALCVGIAGCKTKNTLSYDKTYSFDSISLMGFSGDRISINKYLESQDAENEVNGFIGYFEIAMKLQITFNKNSVGTLCIPQLVSLFGITAESENNELSEMIDSAKAAGTIDDAGNFSVDFDYEVSGDKITIKTVHTKIPEVGTNGDLSFTDALEFLASKTQTANKIVNSNANVVTIKKQKLVLALSFEHRTDANSQNPDVVSEVEITLAK